MPAGGAGMGRPVGVAQSLQTDSAGGTMVVLYGLACAPPDSASAATALAPLKRTLLKIGM